MGGQWTKQQKNCAFEKLFAKNVPHILEKIFLSLDYESYKNCCEVNHTWNELLTSERYLKIGKSLFHDEITEDEKELCRAADKGDAAKVKRLLSSRLLDVNCKHGFSPLHLAVIFRYEAVITLLLNRGADPNSASTSGFTPLYEAVVWDNKALIKTLMEGGADPHRANKF